MTDREKIIAAADLVAKWRDRCLSLAKQGKYWEAATLNEAANEMCAALGPNPYSAPPKPLTTDDAIRDAYKRAEEWNHQTAPTYFPYDTTRVVD